MVQAWWLRAGLTGAALLAGAAAASAQAKKPWVDPPSSLGSVGSAQVAGLDDWPDESKRRRLPELARLDPLRPAAVEAATRPKEEPKPAAVAEPRVTGSVSPTASTPPSDRAAAARIPEKHAVAKREAEPERPSSVERRREARERIPADSRAFLGRDLPQRQARPAAESATPGVLGRGRSRVSDDAAGETPPRTVTPGTAQSGRSFAHDTRHSDSGNDRPDASRSDVADNGSSGGRGGSGGGSSGGGSTGGSSGGTSGGSSGGTSGGSSGGTSGGSSGGTSGGSTGGTDSGSTGGSAGGSTGGAAGGTDSGGSSSTGDSGGSSASTNQ